MMVVGETGSGKTTNMRVLGAALGQLYEEGIVDKDGLYKKVELKILNPKAITAGTRRTSPPRPRRRRRAIAKARRRARRARRRRRRRR